MSDQNLSIEDNDEAAADEAENAAFEEGHAIMGAQLDGTALDAQYEEKFYDKVASWKLRHFSPREFLFLGGSHQEPGNACRGLNTLPPDDLWKNFEKTAKVLDELRTRLRAPVRLSSIYRNDNYNKCLSGAASNSQHKNMRAADFTVDDGKGPTYWRSVLLDMRSEGMFLGGVGIYNTFVHVDTRGENRDWDKRT